MVDWQELKETIIEHWQQRALRQLINANPRLIIAAAIGTVFVLLMVLLNLYVGNNTTGTLEESEKIWLYDLNTDKLFMADKDTVIPAVTPSGPLPNGEPAGVKAYVLSYIPDPNESERFIGFLEKPDPNADDAKPDSVTLSRSQWARGKLIKDRKDNCWVPGDSPEGLAIIREAFKVNENGERPFYCEPR